MEVDVAHVAPSITTEEVKDPPEYGLLTLEELAVLPAPEVKWYAPNWIPVGAKTVLCAYPKTGKTILMFHLLRSILEGGKFCGEQCQKANVVYLSEETQFEFRDQLEDVPGLLGHPNFSVLLAERRDPMIQTWSDTLKWVSNEMDKRDANILVVDTFLSYAKLPEEGENDAATIQLALNEMNFLFRKPERSVVVLHHTAKPQKEHSKFAPPQNPLAIEMVRGSSGFAGGAGHIIVMHGQPERNNRDFAFYGRHLHGATASLVLDKRDHKYLLTDFHRSL